MGKVCFLCGHFYVEDDLISDDAFHREEAYQFRRWNAEDCAEHREHAEEGICPSCQVEF